MGAIWRKSKDTGPSAAYWFFPDSHGDLGFCNFLRFNPLSNIVGVKKNYRLVSDAIRARNPTTMGGNWGITGALKQMPGDDQKEKYETTEDPAARTDQWPRR